MSDRTDLITEAERLVMLSVAEGNPIGEFGVTKEIAFVRGVRWAEEVLTRHEHQWTAAFDDMGDSWLECHCGEERDV